MCDDRNFAMGMKLSQHSEVLFLSSGESDGKSCVAPTFETGNSNGLVGICLLAPDMAVTLNLAVIIAGNNPFYWHTQTIDHAFASYMYE